MRLKSVLCVFMTLLLPAAFGETVATAAICDMTTFQSLDLTEAAAVITSVQLVPATGTSPEYCKVGVNHIMPYDLVPGDADIYTEVWLPSAWNGKYLGTGNGGSAPAIRIDYLNLGLSRGYATANTTMGTHIGGTNALDFRFGIEMSGPDIGKTHPQRWINFGYRATHLMTLAAQKITKTYYGQNPQYSYFLGCSTGGQQALMEAQAYPQDYDGIIAGASALDRTHIHMHGVWTYQTNHFTPESYIPLGKWAIITSKAIAACDAIDGVLDGLIDDPRQCDFDGTSLLCQPGQNPDECLTPAQLETIRMIWTGARNPRTGAQVYPGLTKGSEWFPGYGPLIYPAADAGPAPSLPQPAPLLGGYGLLQWALGPTFDCKYFNWDSDVEMVDMTLAPLLNADNPDLGPFKQSGGKLIIYHGWADPLVFSMDSVNYYGNVMSTMGGVNSAQSFARLFMAPGWGHCGLGGYGPGPAGSDAIVALEKWVEEGKAPGTELNQFTAKGGVPARTRPLCPYPEVARYSGTGSIDDSSNFMCVPPVDIRIEPETLNLKSKGEFTAFITVPEGYDIRDWGVSNVVCEGASAVKGRVSDGRTYVSKFNRQDLKDISLGEAITFTVKGTFHKGGKQAQFQGRDTVRVLE